jgi:hypothetical protein
MTEGKALGGQGTEKTFSKFEEVSAYSSREVARKQTKSKKSPRKKSTKPPEKIISPKRSNSHVSKKPPDFSINNPFSAHMKGSRAGRFWNPPSADKSQSITSKSPWKKTCYFCNGTGANGNCFHCGGTGWE